MTPVSVAPASPAPGTPLESADSNEFATRAAVRATSSDAGRETVREAFYIHSGSDDFFATVHHGQGETSPVAVLMCPAYGWEELCIHRIKFRWATELAAAGHTVLRFDLPGDGDSSGDSTDPDQLQRWIGATRAAARWLRQSGARRVVGLGVGLGALLACLAIGEDAPIDDLILWKLPLSGRSLAREIQMGASVSFVSGGGADPRSGATAQDGSDLLHGGFLDESGKVMTGETFAALSAVNLKTISLPAGSQRNVLLFAGSRGQFDRAEQRSSDWLRGTGVTLTVADGDEYQAMMRYVLFAQAPRQAIGEAAKWLSTLPTDPVQPERGAEQTGQPDRAAEHPDREATGAVEVSEVLEFERDGERIRDRPLAIPQLGNTLYGVLSEPVDRPPEPLTVVYFNGSADRRIGPNRAWVEETRRWAARGVRGVRVDLPGTGDTEGADDAWLVVERHFQDPAHQQVIMLLDALQNRGLGERFMLVGFCSSAVKSLQVSFKDPRVVGLFSVNQPFLLPSRIDYLLHDWWVHDWEPKPTTSRPRVQIMRIAKRALTHADTAYKSLVRFGPRRIDVAKHEIWQATSRGTQYVFLIKPKYRYLREIVEDQRSDRLKDLRQVEIEQLPDNDERFRTLAGQRFVSEQLDTMLARLLARERR